jgi:hypothetical protein
MRAEARRSEKLEAMAVPDQVRQLETQLAQLRLACAFLLDQDTWDRFGRAHASDQEISERMLREREMIERKAASIAALTALVPRLRETDPGAIAAWADAHDALLARFIETELTHGGPVASVGIGVAERERLAWQAVKRGEQPYVEGNTFFIKLDRELYRALFGMDP